MIKEPYDCPRLEGRCQVRWSTDDEGEPVATSFDCNRVERCGLRFLDEPGRVVTNWPRCPHPQSPDEWAG